MSKNPLLELKALGQSVWLDDIHRRMLADGTLRRLIEEDGLAGLTSNPAIFAAAIKEYPEYRRQLETASARGASSLQLYEDLVIEDISQAADMFRPVYERTEGRDGFVSVEVSPHLAHDTAGTVAEAKRLWSRIERPNVLIKVPGTPAGLEAIRALIAAGINVNITLLFSVERYVAVADAFMRGLEARVAEGGGVSSVASVASFFLSRIDTLVDKRLDELASRGNAEAAALRGKAAVAFASSAYEHYRRLIDSSRWRELAARGARTQRLLWASTSTKDPRYSDVKYVEELVAPDTINTMPEHTLEAYRQHGKPEPRLEKQSDEAARVREALSRVGIDPAAVWEQLEAEGVRKFAEPFDELQRWLDEHRRRLS